MKKILNNYYIKEEMEYINKQNDILITDDIYLIENGQEIIASKNKLRELKQLYFVIDFSNKKLNINVAKKLIKKIKNISSLIKAKKDNIGIKEEDKIIIGNIKGIEQQYANDILVALTVPLTNNKKEKYNYLYDNICWYLDNEFISKNLCGFKNNRCIGISKDNNECIGCCKHFKNKKFGAIYESSKKLVRCEYLDEETKRCTAKCIMCKLVTCSEVKKNKNVRFNVWNVLLIRYYFNFIQKIITISTAYTPKEKILKRLCRATIN